MASPSMLTQGNTREPSYPCIPQSRTSQSRLFGGGGVSDIIVHNSSSRVDAYTVSSQVLARPQINLVGGSSSSDDSGTSVVKEACVCIHEGQFRVTSILVLAHRLI